MGELDAEATKAMAGLSKYGTREWLAATAVLVGLCAAAVLLAVFVWPWFVIAAGAAGVLEVWVLAFFRDPDRDSPQGPGLFVSPADGRVSDITQVGPDSELGCDGVKIGIFMNVFNVHVNRCPIESVVESVSHRRGMFLDARNPSASERNESATIRLLYRRDGRAFGVVVRQVAGMVARRIVTDLAEGQELLRGQRIGMIKFGSRLELLVPRELAGDVRVRLGEMVRAGETVLIAAEDAEKEGR